MPPSSSEHDALSSGWVNTLWIGDRLGPVERACLRSVVRQGHPLRLYCYEAPSGVPEGVQLANAAEIIPQDEILTHSGGSPALFSDRFRYQLQRLGRGAWIDADVYLLRSLPQSPLLFGLQHNGRVNGAVLRLPPDCPMLPELLAIFDQSTVPGWLPFRAKLAAGCRLAIQGKAGLAKMPWGAAGPHALTALAKRHDLLRLALPPEAFYPVPHQDAAWILDPSRALDARVVAGTIGIHLWNELIRPFKDAPAPAGSFLARLQAEGA